MANTNYPDMAVFTVNGQTFEIVDGVAREAISKFPIKRIVSENADKTTAIRDLASGSYVLEGKFRPFNGSTGIMSFSSGLLVNVIKGTDKSSVQIFYPTNNCVQFLEITDTTFTRTNVYLSELQGQIGDLDELQTTDKSSLVGAINEVLGSSSSGGGGGGGDIQNIKVIYGGNANG